MHVLVSGFIGILVAIGCVIFASDSVLALLYSPLVVSGTIIALSFLPERRRS